MIVHSSKNPIVLNEGFLNKRKQEKDNIKNIISKLESIVVPIEKKVCEKYKINRLIDKEYMFKGKKDGFIGKDKKIFSVIEEIEDVDNDTFERYKKASKEFESLLDKSEEFKKYATVYDNTVTSLQVYIVFKLK